MSSSSSRSEGRKTSGAAARRESRGDRSHGRPSFDNSRGDRKYEGQRHTARRHVNIHHRHVPRYYYRPYYPFSLHFGYHYTYDHYRHYPPYYPGYPPYDYGVENRPDFGALDLNVKPKDAKVYVNGHYVGTAGDFDGWPRYLWLEEDTYELIFYLEGHRTLQQEYSIHPGLVINVKERLEAGEAVDPEQLTSYPEAERRAPYAPPPARQAESFPRPGDSRDARQEPGRLLLVITPPDASIYLDGEFLGNAEEVDTEILLDPGEHHLQVVRPGFDSYEETFAVEEGDEVEVEVELERG